MKDYSLVFFTSKSIENSEKKDNMKIKCKLELKAGKIKAVPNKDKYKLVHVSPHCCKSRPR